MRPVPGEHPGQPGAQQALVGCGRRTHPCPPRLHVLGGQQRPIAVQRHAEVVSGRAAETRRDQTDRNRRFARHRMHLCLHRRVALGLEREVPVDDLDRYRPRPLERVDDRFVLDDRARAGRALIVGKGDDLDAPRRDQIRCPVASLAEEPALEHLV